MRSGTHSPAREIFRYTQTELTETKSSELSPNFPSPHQESIDMPAVVVVVLQKKDVVQNATNYFLYSTPSDPIASSRKHNTTIHLKLKHFDF